MKSRLVFILGSYPLKYRSKVLLLILCERFLPVAFRKKVFGDSIVESRSILGHVHENGGYATGNDKGILLGWKNDGVFHELLLRWNSSDFLVFEQIFIRGEYAPLVRMLNTNGVTVRSFIDGGANVGCTTVYFKMHFPHARVVAVEPDPFNYEMLLGNLIRNNIPASDALKAALWGSNGYVTLGTDYKDGKDWARNVRTGGADVRAVTLESVMTTFGVMPDFLKIDIEGAEEEVLFEQKASDALRSVKATAIELHSEAISVKVKKLLSSLDFDYFESGETLFAWNRKVLMKN